MNSSSIHTFIVGSMRENAYLVRFPSGLGCIIDPGDDWEYLSEHVNQLDVRPLAILLTHGHVDHVMAAFPLSYLYAIPVMLHPKDTFLLKRLGSTAKKFIGKNISEVIPPPTIPYDIDFLRKKSGEKDMDIIELPGHTPGSVAIRIEKHLFSGDTIFADGAVGRFDFHYSDRNALRTSVTTLLNFPLDYTIYPGHGDMTTVRMERENHGLYT